MKAVLIILIFLAAFFPIYINLSAFATQTKDSQAKAQFTDTGITKEILMPALVEHEGIIYVRDSYWKKYEEAVYADIDGDTEDELIVRFRTSGDDSSPVALTVIYGLNKDDKVIAKTILGAETPNGMELFDIDKDGIKDLILYDHCGNHYTVIMIYSYKDGDYKCLFENGTACYMHEVNTRLDPVRITIGREDWENEEFCYANSDTESLLEVWEWDGEKFAYSPSLSTTPPLTEKEAIEISWQDIKKGMEEIKEFRNESNELQGNINKEVELDEIEAEFMAKAWISGVRTRELFKKELEAFRKKKAQLIEEYRKK